MNALANFMDDLRALPGVAAAIEQDAAWRDHVDAIEHGLQHVAELACEDAGWLAPLDEFHTIVGSDLSLKARMLAISKVFERLHIARQRARGH
jgi:hypothetical protein